MHRRDTLQQSEVAIIGRGVESVLRRLIRFLAGVISLAKLHELIDFIYVEEMDEKLRRENPKRQVTLSAMAMNTGLDTRVINRITNSRGYRRGLLNEAEFFRDFTPAARFLHLWSTDERFVHPDTGLPRALTVRGKSGSLEEMAGLLKLPRGVTIKSIVDQLEGSELIHHDPETGSIRMRTERYLPSPSKDREGALEIGFLSVSRLIDTVLGNLNEKLPDEQRLYQRIYWTNRLPNQQRQVFREKMSALLDEAEQAGRQQLIDLEQSFDTPSQISAGFGLYLFEDAPDDAQE
jgi:hypothetical protein